MPYETEACLRIAGDDPAAVMRRVAVLESLCGQPLEPGGTWAQRDVYVDTADGALRARRYGLRVRSRDGAADVLTLKGPPVASGASGTTRLEIEGMARVCAALRQAGIDADPQSMTPVQSRTTQRTMLSVHDAVELALDVVTYEVAEHRVLHYEIELEAKAPDAPSAMDALTVALLREFAQLRPWPHSKLATGFALEALHVRGELACGLEGGGYPSESLYERIERELRRM